MSKKTQRPKTVCFCYNVTEQELVDAIRQGCTSLMDIRRQTYASTGCAGCSEEIKKLLRKYAATASDSESGGDTQGKVSNG